MNVDGHRVTGNRGCRDRHLNDAARGWSRRCRVTDPLAGIRGRGANGVVGDAAGAVAVPGAGADFSGWGDVGEEEIAAAVIVVADAGAGALAVHCRRRVEIFGLPPSQGNAGGLRLQINGSDVADFRAKTLAVAIVADWGKATGNRKSRWNGDHKQSNQSQKPLHGTECNKIHAIHGRVGWQLGRRGCP